MARQPLVRSDYLPYHVTLRCNNRDPFPIPLEQVWKIITKECFYSWDEFGAEFHAGTLMPNHLHLNLTTPGPDLGVIMKKFVNNITQKINLVSGRIDRIFGSKYRRCLIASGNHYVNAIKYIYRNPVKGGLVERVEDWPYSTLHGLLGGSHLPFPLIYPRSGHGSSMHPESSVQFLEWLNRANSKEVEEAIQIALRRKVFSLPKDRLTRKPKIMLPDCD